MNKLMITTLMLCTTLTGCMEFPAETTDTSQTYKMPEGMEDCKVFELQSTEGKILYVVRCPMATSTMETHKSGKTHVETNVTVPNIL